MTIKALAQSGKLAHNANPSKTVPPGDHQIMEPKYDGWRILAEVHESGVHFYSRSGKTYDGKLPKVEAELLAHFPAGSWLDGEAVAIRVEQGTVLNEWSIAQSVLTTHGGHAAADKITFMVFDLLQHGAVDIRSLAFGKRRAALEQVFAQGEFSAVRLTNQMDASQGNHDALVEMGFEGSMVKSLLAPYGTGKRGAGSVKIKPQTTIEVVVTGFKPGENGFKGMVGALVFGQHDENGVMVERGRCSGMDMKTRMEITANPSKWLGKVIEIAHNGAMVDGLRHPQFKRARPDRSPESVVIHDA